MLNRLAIQNYALIDTLDITFGKNLNIITGETGAGKSIILGALSLILGQRAESKYFYNQQKKCIIEGIFKISGYHLTDFFAEHDLDYDAETVLRREITADGKSRSFVNDTPVNLATLKLLGEKLIEIHSQHALLEVNDPDFQLMVLDVLAANQDALAQYQTVFAAYRKNLALLNQLSATNAGARQELDYLQFQFDELEQAGLQEDEQDLLEDELNTLTHAEEIKRNLQSAAFALTDSDDAAVNQLKNALQHLQQAEKFNTSLAPLSARLHSTLIELKDIAAETEQQDLQTTLNESRLSELTGRLDVLYTLQKKHRLSSNTELIALRETFAKKINSVHFGDEQAEKLETEIKNQTTELTELAGQLNKKRLDAVPDFEQQLRQLLSTVGMEHAVLKAELSLLAGGDFTATGLNQIEFLFSANKGQQPLPMSKVASGGELSRLMLSLKSLVAKHRALPTLIFDEIDTGISGGVAAKVGAVMENLSTDMQVIAITHLPQIASKGEAHYVVYKKEEAENTQTNIRLLKTDERITEIAKMLSGNRPGASAIQNAKELLEQ